MNTDQKPVKRENNMVRMIIYVTIKKSWSTSQMTTCQANTISNNASLRWPFCLKGCSHTADWPQALRWALSRRVRVNQNLLMVSLKKWYVFALKRTILGKRLAKFDENLFELLSGFWLLNHGNAIVKAILASVKTNDARHACTLYAFTVLHCFGISHSWFGSRATLYHYQNQICSCKSIIFQCHQQGYVVIDGFLVFLGDDV